MKNNSPKKRPLNIFYSYAHEDHDQRKILSKYLIPLRRDHLIKEWDDTNIQAGEEFENVINKNIYISDIIILIITVDFLASDYCWEKEMPVALELHKKNKARVIPVMIEPISLGLSATPFGKLTVLPKDGKPISKWDTRKDGWTNVAIAIGEVINQWNVGNKEIKKADPKQKTAKLTQDSQPISIQHVNNKSKRFKNKVQRIIYDAQHKENLSGKIIRKEGDHPVTDSVANIVYENLGKVYDFFFAVYGRNSADNKGLPLSAIIHYGRDYNNIFWDGRNIVIGDASKEFKNFHGLDFLAVDFTYAINQYESKLEYWGQSGSLITASGHIFGTLIKQYYSNQTAQEASWLMGEDSIIKKGIARGLYSLSNPGTAYVEHPILGTDTRISHVRDMLPIGNKKASSDYDSGGIHQNCGIPSRAFYLASLMIEGHAWEKAGRIWYESLISKDLPKAPSFLDFAKITVAVCDRLYGKNSVPTLAYKRGWELVGIDSNQKTMIPKIKTTKRKK